MSDTKPTPEERPSLRTWLVEAGPWWLLPMVLGVLATALFILFGQFEPVVKAWYSAF